MRLSKGREERKENLRQFFATLVRGQYEEYAPRGELRAGYARMLRTAVLTPHELSKVSFASPAICECPRHVPLFSLAVSQ
jgi:hypothetical protein